jgi:solute carrier family 25 (mitochondrial phosphate transporter), member 3
VGILAALIPPTDQPRGELQQRLLATNAKEGRPLPSSSPRPQQLPQPPTTSSAWTEDLGALLPSPYHVVLVTTPSTTLLRIAPPLPLYQVGVDDEFGLSGTATPFGPLSSGLLVRELPSYSASIYTILGLSGATGCALTHSLVIPLDVLKTKAQADPDGYSNLLQGANKVLEEEGVAGLLTGAQATLAGYFWYGMSVYPSYTFFKRCFSGSPWAVAHEYDVALIAGALASVIASLGLTPLEAARIRVVSDPGRYKPLGLTGTLQVISAEGALYAGLPSLLIRQIMFGSVKFLAFERACEVIYSTAPSLRDATWTALGVSLVAGGLAGTLSSIVSQPADSILTYVAQDTKGRAAGSVSVLSSARAMIETGGFRALFQGLGSRCVWAGSIIAGQFLLYDVFRTFFGVNANDLSQVWNFDI